MLIEISDVCVQQSLYHVIQCYTNIANLYNPILSYFATHGVHVSICFGGQMCIAAPENPRLQVHSATLSFARVAGTQQLDLKRSYSCGNPNGRIYFGDDSYNT